MKIKSNLEKSKIFTSDRIMMIGGFVILSTASFISLTKNINQNTIIPYPSVTVPVMNVSSAVMAFFLIFFPNFTKLCYSVFFIQSINTILTGYEFLGIFLYYGMITLMFCNGEFKTKIREKMTVFLIVLIILIFGIIPYGGYEKFLLSFSEAVFFFGFYFCIYKKLESQLSSIFPAYHDLNKITLSSRNLPSTGSELNLLNYGLSERQCKFVLDNLLENSNYSDLSEKYYVSLSTVKKDMCEVFKKFGVDNLESFRLLMMQYKIRKPENLIKKEINENPEIPL